jgi:hypothetical protein
MPSSDTARATCADVTNRDDDGGRVLHADCPVSTLGVFADLLRLPEAADVVQRMKRFARAVDERPALSDEALADEVGAFYVEMDAFVHVHPLWACAMAAELDGARDGLEHYLSTRLYPRAMPALAAAERRVERGLLSRRRALVPILTPESLGLSRRFCRQHPWPRAAAELRAIETHLTPRRKLACVVNCCARLGLELGASAHAYAAEHGSSAGGSAHGADELFPALVIMLCNCPVRELARTISYASAHRHPLRLEADGEARCYLTHVLAALHFVESCTAEHLVGVSPGEFAAALDGPRRGEEDDDDDDVLMSVPDDSLVTPGRQVHTACAQGSLGRQPDESRAHAHYAERF